MENIHEKLREESVKKVKRTGCYTRKALRAQEKLYDEYFWSERNLYVEDNGIKDRDWNEIYYDGYDNENEG